MSISVLLYSCGLFLIPLCGFDSCSTHDFTMKENDPFSMNCSGCAHDTHPLYIQRWLFIIQYSTDITMMKEAAGGPGVVSPPCTYPCCYRVRGRVLLRLAAIHKDNHWHLQTI